MPNNDGTGPMGQGSMTGRGSGRCQPARNNGLRNQQSNNNDVDEFNQNFYGNRGFRRGFNQSFRRGNNGGGRGFGRGKR